MTEPREQEIELSTLWKGIRRFLPWTLLGSLLLGGAVYAWSSQQDPVYESRSSLLVTGSAAQPNDAVLNTALVKAPPLPAGAVEEALYSTLVMQPLLQSLAQDKAIPQAERQRLAEDITEELGTREFRTVQLNARLEQYGNGSGIYTITTRAGTPESAAALANLTVQSLLNWDRERALSNVRLAQKGFEAQLRGLDAQLKAGKLTELERSTLVSRRASLLDSLTQVNILEQSTTGVLSLLSPATPVAEPVAPKPVRNAVLATLLSTLLGLGIAALLTVTDRRVRNEDDLLDLGLPVLTTLPRVRRRDVLLNGMVGVSRQTGVYEAIGFLRVNLMTALGERPHPVVMITSSTPGEGKSSVTATLADNLGSSGRRVLLIDADLRRGTQGEIWKKAGQPQELVQLMGEGGATTTQEALLDPANVRVTRVAPSIDVLPAGPGIHDTLSKLTRGEFKRALELWRSKYDIVLVDSAPLLALADGLVVGSGADAVVMVVEQGVTDLRAIRNALSRAERSGLNLVGVVLNKADAREESGYSYSYSYTPTVRSRG